MLLAVKFTEDYFYPNSFYAKVGGIPSEELNRLELAMLFLLRFELLVDRNEFTYYIDNLKSGYFKMVCKELSEMQDLDASRRCSG